MVFTVEYGARSGSVACSAMFASSVGAGFLAYGASALSLAKMDEVLSQCVEVSARTGTKLSAEDMIRCVFEQEFEGTLVERQTANRARAAQEVEHLSKSNTAVLFIKGFLQERGDSDPCNAILFLRGEIHVVDCSCPGGFSWARSPDSDAQAVVDWIFNSLLPGGHCHTELVDVVFARRASAKQSAVDCSCSHETHVVTCSWCQWRRHGPKYQRASQYCDAVTSQMCSAVACTSSGTFGMGCALCARLAQDGKTRPSKWTHFKIQGRAITIDGVRKHLRTAKHKEALKEYARGACHCGPDLLEELADSAQGSPPKTSLEEALPRKLKFMDVIRGCFEGQTGRGFAKSFPRSNELETPLISTGVFRDESRWAHRKMVTSAAAVIDDEQHEMLRKAVRIAFADDDRDQHRVLRIRVVWTEPTVGYAEFFGSLLKDYGFDAAACQAATVEGLKRLCSRRTGSQFECTNYELDTAMWDEVRRKIFAGATDGAAVALKGVNELHQDGVLPALRYQFRDRPHTTRTCVKMALEMSPESREVRERLITGKESFARRAKNSRRFQEVWLRKQREEPDQFWNITKDLGYAEQRYDSRSKPMSTFLLKLGPALEVLQELSQDPRRTHRDDALWASSLLEFLSGEQGFLRMVLFAVDTDFAVATHRLVRLQDASEPDISVAAHEVQECVDICRVLFHDGRVFDKAPNGTYTNHLLQGFRGVSRQLLLRTGGAVSFGWPSASEEGALLKDAVIHAKALFKSASMFFSYNFPHHAWRTRFEAFHLSSSITHAVRRGHITALAEKEGVQPERAWQQFFEALPHAMRLFKQIGDARAAWSTYLDTFCRQSRSQGWRPQADCIVPLVLTYVGILDGSSDVERNFSQMGLLECRHSRRHHSEQFLQDLLKVRLHAPEEFRDALLASSAWNRRVENFLQKAQHKYSVFFGSRVLASRSTMHVKPEDKKLLFSHRRPRWQHLGLKGTRTQAARRDLWEADVQQMLVEQKASKRPESESFVGHIKLSDVEEASILAEAEARMAKRSVAYELCHRDLEREGRLVAPPPPVRTKDLLKKSAVKKKILKPRAAPLFASSPSSSSSKVASSSTFPAASTSIGPKLAVNLAKTAPSKRKPRLQLHRQASGVDGLELPAKLRVFMTAAAVGKHRRCAAELARRKVLVNDPALATHHVGSGQDKAAGMYSMSSFLHELRNGVAAGA